MELWQAMQQRRSIRKFKPDPIADDTIRELLEAARLAPSGSNCQPWRFVLIKSTQAKEQLAQATPLPFVTQAPVVIAVCIDRDVLSLGSVKQRVSELMNAGAFVGTPLESFDAEAYAKRRGGDASLSQAYLRLNAAIAIDHLTLRAVDLGLGTCWVMMFDGAKLKEMLGLEERYEPVALLPVGYPDQNPGPRPRLPLDEFLLKEV